MKYRNISIQKKKFFYVRKSSQFVQNILLNIIQTYLYPSPSKIDSFVRNCEGSETALSARSQVSLGQFHIHQRFDFNMFSFFLLIFIGVQFLYNVVLVSVVSKMNQVYLYPLFFRFPSHLAKGTLHLHLFSTGRNSTLRGYVIYKGHS